MYRCPKCRARKKFYIKQLGYEYIIKEDEKSFHSKQCELVPRKNLWQRLFPIFNKDKEKKIITLSIFRTTAKNLGYKMKCMECGHTDDEQAFYECAINPMEAFDTANLCDCGGEIWQDFEVNKTPAVSTNDFDGDQRTVTSKVKSVVRCERCGKTIQ